MTVLVNKNDTIENGHIGLPIFLIALSRYQSPLAVFFSTPSHSTVSRFGPWF